MQISKEYRLFDKEFKSELCADDATFALDCSFESSKELINILEAFKLISGLKINNKKTSACIRNRILKKY